MPNFERYVPNAAETDPLNVRVNASISGTLDELPDTFENWDKDKVREAAEGFMRADETRIKQRANADAFLELHPEFLDTQGNGETMNRTLEALYGEHLYSVSEFEKAYEVCRATNARLDIDQVVIVKQQQAAANQRAKAAREQRARENRVFSEDEKYNMSLEELREAENREIQKQFERLGQEGGY